MLGCILLVLACLQEVPRAMMKEEKRLSERSVLPQRDEYRPSKVLGIPIDDTSFPLFRPRALYWLQEQLLWDIRLVSRFKWGRRRSLQGESILGKMSGHS